MNSQTIRMLLRVGFLVIGSIIFVGCGLFNSDDRDELEEQLAKWRSYNLDSYTFEFRASCFCITEFNEWVSVTVRGDTIAGVTILRTEQPPVEIPLNNWLTIDQLFDKVFEVVQEADEFDVAYNKRYGYPELISVDFDKQISDDEFTYNSMNLVRDE